MLEPSFLIGLASVVALGMAAHWLASLVRVPAIILLLLAGMAAGAVGLVDPVALFGPAFPDLVGIAVAIILFEGGLTLRLRDIGGVERPVQLLVTVGVVVTWAVGTLAAHQFLDLSFELAILLGAVVVVSGPTVIAPLIRSMRPAPRLGSVMRWEGVIIDPVGAMLAVVAFEVVRHTEFGDALQATLVSLAGFLVVGFGLGLTAAAVFVVGLKKHWIPDHLHNAAAVSIVIVVLAAADWLSPESGLLAATVMGIVLANQRSTAVGRIVEFSESVRVVLIASLFIVISASVDLSLLADLGWGTVAFVMVLVVVARPLTVAVSTVGSDLRWTERLVLAWTAPRGIVAAAVASVLSVETVELGLSDGASLLPVVFVVIAATVTLYGLTTPLLARALGVANPAPTGVLIVGAGEVERAIGTALDDNGFTVRLATAVRHDERLARMSGLDTRYGPLLSDDAPDRLDLTDISAILALSANDELNALATLRYSSLLGRRNVYQLAPQGDAEVTAHVDSDVTARILFGPDVTYATILERLNDGGQLKTTRVSEVFGLHDVLNDSEGVRIALFVIPADGRLTPITADMSDLNAGENDMVISLSAEANTTKPPASTDAAGGDEA
jgi:NhaP-type Na+/H+ or K+/H+ antiporter